MQNYVLSVTAAIFILFIGHQVLKTFKKNRLIKPLRLNQAKQILLILFGTFYIFFGLNLSMTASILVGMLIFHFFIIWYLQIKRKKSFEKFLIQFLNEIIMYMKSGKSLRDAVLLTSLQAPFCDLHDYIELSSQLGDLRSNIKTDYLTSRAKWLLEELLKILSANIKTIDRVSALRSQIQSEIQFTKKINQVMSQINAQIGVILVLYLLAIIYTSWSHFNFLFTWPFGLSLGLLLLGIVSTRMIVRSFRWKF